MTKEQFKKFAKEEFGYDISFEESDNPDTYESLFGSCKSCEHAPTTYEEYYLHTCCPDAYTDKAAGCELFKEARNCGVEQTENNWYKCKKCEYYINPDYTRCHTCKAESECMEDFDEEIPKKKTFWIHDMDITFDKELTQEEMEKRFFDALKTVGVIGHRGCPN